MTPDKNQLLVVANRRVSDLDLVFGRLGSSDTLIRYKVYNEADSLATIQIDRAVIDGKMQTFKSRTPEIPQDQYLGRMVA